MSANAAPSDPLDYASTEETVIRMKGTKTHVLQALEGILQGLNAKYSVYQVLTTMVYDRHKSVPAKVGKIQVLLSSEAEPECGGFLDAPEDSICVVSVFHQRFRK